MKLSTCMALVFSIVFTTSVACAGGVLNFYNWGEYTNPELIKKFTKETGIKVNLDSFDSNEMMMAKIKAGGHGYDLAVPSYYMLKPMNQEDMLQKINADQMSNFKNVMPEHVNVDWDPGRQYSIPWHWGTTGICVNTKFYKGRADSWSLLYDPPEELKGRINMIDGMDDVIGGALYYLGLPQCNSSKDDLKKVYNLLVKAKKSWASIDYGIMEKMSAEDVYVSQIWNGASLRMRADIPTIKYILPKEGVGGWADVVVLLKGAKNVKEAKMFMNFLMAPENIAMNSNYTYYSNSIAGSEKYMKAELSTAPEIVGYEGAGKIEFVGVCEQEVVQMYTKIWNNLLK